MRISQKQAGRATRALVLGVVISSISFGAYGLGRAARPASAVPKNAYHAFAQTDQPIGWCGLSGCTEAQMDTFVSVVVPRGKYVVDISGVLSNTDDANQVICRMVSISGTAVYSYTSQFMTTLLGQDTPVLAETYLPIAGTATVRVSSPTARLGLDCGAVAPIASGQINIYQAQITATRVTSLKNVNVGLTG